MAALLAALNLSCVGPLGAEDTVSSISTASDNVADIIKGGDLSMLKPLISGEIISFEPSGKIEENVECFLNWTSSCTFEMVPIRDILHDPYFKYYYHIDDNNIVVSYIRNSARDEFDRDPPRFLAENYLADYFSCHFTFLNGRWMLTESVCFSETEGPFSPEPEV